MIIPNHSPIYQQLDEAAQNDQLVVFSGLPGVGKSLYILEFSKLAKKHNRTLTVIQWDIARKGFETDEILERFPMHEGTVHNGLKLCAGVWLIDTIRSWLNRNQNDSNQLLLIEAPLVGHRFIELAKEQNNVQVESFLKGERSTFFVPIPSKRIRKKIEEARAAQVAEDAKVWMGAKPSVMLMIWKMICGVANKMGKHVEMDGQPPYDPEIYEFVFSKILKNRRFSPLFIDEVFNVDIKDEKELHSNYGLKADDSTANKIASSIDPKKIDIDGIVAEWYIT